MDTRRRTIRVWTILVMAMAVTSGLLFALQTEKGSSTLFSLSGYYVNSAYPLDVLRISSSATPFKWRGLSIEYSDTQQGDIASLAEAEELSSSDLLNYHFVISNGSINGNTDPLIDGLIEPTVRWQSQFPCTEQGSWQKTDCVRICVIGDGKITEKQSKSILSLVEGLCVNYDIPLESVDYRIKD